MNAPNLVAVPPAVVTVTSFRPNVPEGVTAMINVAAATTLVAALPPTFTLVAPLKFVPAIVIQVPPDIVPLEGITLEITGISLRAMVWSLPAAIAETPLLAASGMLH